MASRRASPGRLTRLRGRGAECSALDGIVSDIRAGTGRALVVRGEAGVGKTALLEYLLDAASDLHVVRATGVESEMELAYAGLHQLCAPLLDRLGRLPEPQHEALRIVFGLSSGNAPDQFLVGLAVLSLLSEAADERPLLCVVDDAQWLDHASALTLAFVGRRLLAEPVALVFAARETDEALEGLPELEVGGLREGDAQALLGSVIRFVLDERIRDRIVAETRGNPLALLELPRGLTATQLAGGFGLLGAQALSGRIEESFQRRLEALADQTRMLLLIAAADPVGDPLLLWRAADRLGIGALARECGGGGIAGDRRTGDVPPSAGALGGLPDGIAREHRRAAHLALAEVTDRRIDPDRRAWHLAAAASGPDEDVASELERSADRAQARGGLAAAAAFLRRAVALTEDSARRSERALAAAQASLQAGAFDVALQLLAAAEVAPLDELQRARVELLRAEAAYSQSRGSDAPALLLHAARTLEPLDQRPRARYVSGCLERLAVRRRAGDERGAATRFPGRRSTHHEAADPPRPADLLLDGFAMALVEGRAASGPVSSALRADLPATRSRSKRCSAGDGLRPRRR